jgi:hypothetical protein
MEGQTQTTATDTTQTAAPDSPETGATPGAPADGAGAQGGGSPAPEQKTAQEGQPDGRPFKKDRVGMTLAQVMSRENAIRKREKALEDREKGLDGQKGVLDRLKEDPLAVLQEAGMDFRKVVDLGLNGKKDPTVEDKVAALEAQIAADKQARADAQKDEAQKQYERNVQQHMDSIGQTISKDAETYELLNNWDGATELVNEVMVLWHKEHGKVLDYAEACALTEKGLHEQVTGKLLGTSKVKKFLEEQAAKAAQPAGATGEEKGATKQKTQAGGKAKEPRTLNNAQESVVVHKAAAMTDDERLARATKALEGGGAAA